MQWGEFEIAVSGDGLVTTLSRDGEAWLRLELRGVRSTGRFSRDADEIEHAFILEDGVRLAARHSAADAWTARWAFSNPDSEPIAPRIEVELSADEAAWCWVWAAGAEARIAVAPRTGFGPAIGLRLAHGWFARGERGFRLVPPDFGIPPGGRLVTSLRATRYRNLGEFSAGLPAWLPPLALVQGQPLELATPDWAVVLPSGTTGSLSGDVLEVPLPAGQHRLALHSPRGVTWLDASVAPSLDYALGLRASQIVQAGVADGGADACVLAEALARNLVSAPQAADRVLRTLTPSPGDLLGVAALVAQAPRGSGEGLIEAAFDLLAASPVVPGYGRIVMRTWLASLTVGLDAHERAAGLLSRPVTDPLAAFELSLLTLRSAEVAEPILAGIVHALGGLLPGQPLCLTELTQAQLLGLLRLCPEEWPLASVTAETALKTERRLLAGLVAEPSSDVLGWLAVGASLT